MVFPVVLLALVGFAGASDICARPWKKPIDLINLTAIEAAADGQGYRVEVDWTPLKSSIEEARKTCKYRCEYEKASRYYRYYGHNINKYDCDDITLNAKLQNQKSGESFNSTAYRHEDSDRFTVPKCGIYSLNVYDKETVLAKVKDIVVLPSNAKEVQVHQSYLSAAVNIPEDKGCLMDLNKDQDLRLECGQFIVTKLDLKSTTMVMPNLFPNRTFSCSLTTSSHHLVQTIEFETLDIPAPIFVYHEQRIWMLDNQPTSVTNQTAINYNINITDLGTNLTVRGSALEAITQGIGGLTDGSQYRICSLMKQAEPYCSVWGCLQSEQCFELTAISHLTHLEKAVDPTNGGGSSDSTAIIVLAIFLVLALVVGIPFIVIYCKQQKRTSEAEHEEHETSSVSYFSLLRKMNNENNNV